MIFGIREQKQSLYRVTLLFATGCLLWVMWNYFLPGTSPVSCLFRNITGLKCPSCGTTGSVMEILKGNYVAAAVLNPLGFPALFLLTFIPTLLVHDIVTGKQLYYDLFKAAEKVIHENKKISGLLISLAVANWIYILGT